MHRFPTTTPNNTPTSNRNNNNCNHQDDHDKIPSTKAQHDNHHNNGTETETLNGPIVVVANNTNGSGQTGLVLRNSGGSDDLDGCRKEQHGRGKRRRGHNSSDQLFSPYRRVRTDDRIEEEERARLEVSEDNEYRKTISSRKRSKSMKVLLDKDGDDHGSDNGGCNGSDGDDVSHSKENGEYSAVWEKCFHCFCPFLALLRALLRCDMDAFWKIVPPILVTKAFYSSVIALGLCTLFKVQRRTLPTEDQYIPNLDDIVTNVTNITSSPGNTPPAYQTETYFFGLYTYTGNVEMGKSLGDEMSLEFHRVQTCRFDMREVDAEAPDRLFFDDGAFTVARAFAISAVGLGFLSTTALFLLTAANCSPCCHVGAKTEWWRRQKGRIRYILAGALTTCGIFQSFAFLVFASSVCRDDTERGFEYEDRHCSLEEGVGIIFSSCFCWWFTAIGLLKMPIGAVSGGSSGESEEVAIECIDFSGVDGGGKWKKKLDHNFEAAKNEDDENVTIL